MTGGHEQNGRLKVELLARGDAVAGQHAHGVEAIDRGQHGVALERVTAIVSDVIDQDVIATGMSTEEQGVKVNVQARVEALDVDQLKEQVVLGPGHGGNDGAAVVVVQQVGRVQGPRGQDHEAVTSNVVQDNAVVGAFQST